MLRHVVLFEFTPDATDDQITALEQGLAGLPGAIPAIRRFEFGRDLGLADGNFDLALVADFDDAEGYREYAGDATHRQVIADRVRPIVEMVTRVQYEV